MNRFDLSFIVKSLNANVKTASNLGTQEVQTYRQISTDTRTLMPGDVFLALRGKNFDGHDYIAKAIEKGATLLIVETSAQIPAKLKKMAVAIPDLIEVQDSLSALQTLAKSYRDVLNVPVIGITGSIGKTTTRQMVMKCLSELPAVTGTENNNNNEIGLPQTILAAARNSSVLVLEMGMRALGEIETLSEIARPDIAIVTGIGYSHIGRLKNKENILQAKLEIVKGLKKKGLLILNLSDELLYEWALKHQQDYKIWGIQAYNDQRDIQDFPIFKAENIKSKELGLSFKISAAPFFQEVQVELNLPAVHFVQAALFGIATAYALALDPHKSAQYLKDFSSTESRMVIKKVKSLHLIYDAYNAAPESMKSALQTLSQVDHQSGRLVAILGGILELGDYAVELHEELAKDLISEKIALVLLVGEETRTTYQYLRAKSPETQAFWFKDMTALHNDIMSLIQSGDWILLKGSRAYEMEKAGLYLEEYWEEA